MTVIVLFSKESTRVANAKRSMEPDTPPGPRNDEFEKQDKYKVQRTKKHRIQGVPGTHYIGQVKKLRHARGARRSRYTAKGQQLRPMHWLSYDQLELPNAKRQNAMNSKQPSHNTTGFQLASMCLRVYRQQYIHETYQVGVRSEEGGVRSEE